MGSKVQEVELPDEKLDLDWIQLRRNYEDNIEPETPKQKLLRKIKSNPIVPIGCLATASALCFGLWNFRTGNRRMSQLMMRTRIAAQGFTLFALVAGVVMTYGKDDKKTKDGQ